MSIEKRKIKTGRACSHEEVPTHSILSISQPETGKVQDEDILKEFKRLAPEKQHALFKKVEMIASIIKEIERIAAPGTKVELLNRIEFHPDTLKESLEKWGQGHLDEKVSIKGAHRVVELDGNCFKSIISLALNYMNPKITPYHEAFHSVQEFLLTNEEKAILAARYSERNGISSHERQAQAFADYVAQRNRTPLASIRTIKKFIESIAAYLKRVEVTTSDIFEAAYRGDLRKRAETTPFHPL